MARLSLVAERRCIGTPITGAEFLEAYGMLHNAGDGCAHCDGWQRRHYRDGGWIDCTDPRCICTLAPSYPPDDR